MGLVSWERNALHLASSPDELRAENLHGFWETLELVQNNRRLVPIPRRIVRFLAGGASKVETATVLGHVLRCCYRQKRGRVTSIGNCSAPWVESVFEVNATCVKQARARLTRLGLFLEQEQQQWHRNRYGSRIEVNLNWEEPKDDADANQHTAKKSEAKVDEKSKTAETPSTDSRPPVAVIHNQTPTPIETGSLLTEGSKHQPSGEAPLKPPTGVFQTGVGTGKRKQETRLRLPEPRLRHVLPEDLKLTERLLKLHVEASKLALAPVGERGQLEVVALAVHALRYGTKNPPGLFSKLMKDQKWHYITQDDEDIARRRLQEYRNSQDGSSAPKPASSIRSGPKRVLDVLGRVTITVNPSEPTAGRQADALLVGRLIRGFGARGVHDDAVMLRELRKVQPEWTEERWNLARVQLAAGVRMHCSSQPAE